MPRLQPERAAAAAEEKTSFNVVLKSGGGTSFPSLSGSRGNNAWP